jgi:CheY-like chemotaxis protein
MSSEPSPTRPAVLLVDDSTEQRDLYQLMLGQDFETLAASSGRQALMLAEDYQPSVVVLDICMPEMDGFEVCRRLKSHPLTEGIPVIILTGIEDHVRPKAFLAGAFAVLTKPCSQEKLTETISAAIGRSARQAI